MKRYSEAGKHYATLSRMLDCLIAFLLIAVIGFATIPSFLLLNVGPTSEASYFETCGLSHRAPSAKRSEDCRRSYSPNPDPSAVSGVTKLVVFGHGESAHRFQNPIGDACGI
jgi:hypothetical protein